jgi:hypothetical protein
LVETISTEEIMYRVDQWKVMTVLGTNAPKRPEFSTSEVVATGFKGAKNADRRVRNAYRKLRKEGHIEITDRGTYRLTSKGASWYQKAVKDDFKPLSARKSSKKVAKKVAKKKTKVAKKASKVSKAKPRTKAKGKAKRTGKKAAKAAAKSPAKPASRPGSNGVKPVPPQSQSGTSSDSISF